MDLETLVRDTLREHADDAPSAEGLLDTVSRRPRAVLRWSLAGLSAAAVLAVAVGVVVLRGDDPSRPATRAGSPVPTTVAPSPVAYAPPAGYRQIPFHDYLIAVPDGVPVVTTPCVLPARYVEMVDPSTAYDCVAGGDPSPTLTVRISADGSDEGIALAPALVNGMSARLGYGTLHGMPGFAGQVVFAAEQVAVTVTAPTRDEVRTILTSVVAGADPQGCAAELPSALSNTAATALVPAAPSSAVRCVYFDHAADESWLFASYALRAGAVPALVRAINELPGDVGNTGVGGGPAYEHDLVLFTYAHGSNRTLTVDLSDPTVYSDGTRNGYDDHNVVTDRLRAASS